MLNHDYTLLHYLKRATNKDNEILYCISNQLNLYFRFLDSDYAYLTNYLKFRYGIVVRQGYVICNNNYAVEMLHLMSNIPRSKIKYIKGAF